MSVTGKLPIRRRLFLLTVLGAVGGALFTPFVLASAGTEAPSVSTVLATFTLGAAFVTALSAWGGLRLADRAGLPMHLLRSWESRTPLEPGALQIGVVYPLILGGLFGLAAALVANLISVPDNPGSLPVRILTTPFAAVVPEVLVHLLLMSGIVFLTRRVWIAVLISAVAFVVLFHGNPPEGAPAVTLFVVSLNFSLGVLTGWVFSRWGFTGAMLTHAAAHLIVLGVN